MIYHEISGYLVTEKEDGHGLIEVGKFQTHDLAMLVASETIYPIRNMTRSITKLTDRIEIFQTWGEYQDSIREKTRERALAKLTREEKDSLGLA